MKRSREQDHRVRQQDKDARKTQRAVDKKTRHRPQGEGDPDIAGIVPGPQPSPSIDDKEGARVMSAVERVPVEGVALSAPTLLETGPERRQRRPTVSKKLYVGNLSYSTTSADLQELFAPFGKVESASVVEDRDTGRSKGFGFVEMSSDDEAQAAISALNGKENGGRALKVNEARPREDRGGGGGRGGRGGGRY